MMDQITPSVIILKDGGVLMCNEKFENMIKETMGAKNVPANFLKFIQGDVEAKDRIVEIINKTLANKNQGSISTTYEIVFNKGLLANKKDIKK